MKYNVGDKVRIKSLDWYNKNKNENGIVNIGTGLQNFGWNRVKYCGKTLTIRDISETTAINLLGQIVKIQFYLCSCDDMPDVDGLYWSDEMIEGLVKEEDLNLKFKDGDRVFNTATRKWVNIIEFDIETGLYIVRYDDGIQGRSLESELYETDQVSVN